LPDIGVIKQQCVEHNIELVILTDLVSESEQVRKGFGNLVGIARYPITFPQDKEFNNDSESYEW
jgi:peptide subunit release factor 1 (eRF1)